MAYVRALIALVLMTQALPAAGAGSPATVAAGDSAFMAHRIEEARALYAAVDGPPAARAEAQRKMARIAWWYFEQHDEARVRLLAAAEAGLEHAEQLIELSRVERDRRCWPASREAAARALLLAEDDLEARAARAAWAGAVVAEATAADLEGDALPDAARLRDAVRVLETSVRREPGVLGPSRDLLRGALLLADGPAAALGWRSYFRVTGERVPYPLLRDAAVVLEGVGAKWPRTEAAAVALVEALAGSRLFTEAELASNRFTEPVRARVAAVRIYAAWNRALREATDAYYRRLARGQAAPDDLKRAFLRVTVARWRALGLPGAPPPPDAKSLDEVVLGVVEAANEVLGARFGTYVSLDETAGFFDLHMGHALVDAREEVEQYGRRAEIRFVLLDEMVSNGFQSWAWNYESQHGGWAGENVIHQVRPAYAAGPLEAWERLTDPVARKESETEIARLSAEDAARARRDPLGFLPGLRARLTWRALESLRGRLVRQGLKGAALRTAFLAEFESAVRASAIAGHEGRHVIDQRAGIEDGAELEYRAKLSEIAFAPLPSQALANILAPYVGDETPHGQATLRLVRGLVSWMDAHADEISGLERGQPLQPQLDRLSSDQLRRAVRSLDPLGAAGSAEALPAGGG